jgi:predicted nucleic acid-binding protein
LDDTPLLPSTSPALVLDTNVVFDALVFANPAVAPVIDAIRRGRVRWLACPAMRGEAAWVLNQGLLARWRQGPPERRWASVEQAMARFDELATAVADPPALPLPRPRCSDGSDQVFVDLALHQRAQWLLTRDRALLKLARRLRPLGVRVLVPEAWRAI